MRTAACVAVDWGTSSFRLWLIDHDGEIIAERRSDEGMVAAAGPGFATVLQSHLGAVGATDDLPVLICGMAGARQGWVEAGYIDTPAALAALVDAAVRIPDSSRDIRILPGIAQRDPHMPDVMRGEETQLLGALGLHPAAEVLVCMPGTHSKWVGIGGGKVARFSTFMTGELFGVISRDTILSHALAGAEPDLDAASFRAAVTAAYQNPAAAANHLFQVRSRQLLFGGSAAAAREAISGTLIGCELAAGLARGMPKTAIRLIASGRLGTLYRLAFETLSVAIEVVDAEQAVRRGLAMAAQAIWPISRGSR